MSSNRRVLLGESRRVSLALCPVCGEEIDGVSFTGDQDDLVELAGMDPTARKEYMATKPGCASVCVYCGAINTYAVDPISPDGKRLILVVPGPELIADWKQQPGFWERVVQMSADIKKWNEKQSCKIPPHHTNPKKQ